MAFVEPSQFTLHSTDWTKNFTFTKYTIAGAYSSVQVQLDFALLQVDVTFHCMIRMFVIAISLYFT